jgi:hypothetical protein
MTTSSISKFHARAANAPAGDAVAAFFGLPKVVAAAKSTSHASVTSVPAAVVAVAVKVGVSSAPPPLPGPN